MNRALDYLVVALAMAMIGVGAVGAYDLLTQPAIAGQKAPVGIPGPFGPPLGGAERVRFLLLGADKRPDDKGRSDTILLVTINARTQRVALLGIPRDLRVPVPGNGTTKINHSYALGGADLTRRTVEELLGEPIDHTALIYFQGFVQAVDALGGVYVEVPDVEGHGRGMNYDEWVVVNRTYIDHDGHLHMHLKPGYQKLDGAGALGFVRYRMGDSDFKRSDRQQQFLRAVVQQHLHAGNLRRVLEAGGRIMKHMETDIEWDTAADVARLLREAKQDDIWSGTVPAGDAKIGGVYYAVPLETEFRDMLREMTAHLDGVPVRRPLDVHNGTETRGLARRTADRLQEQGYEIGEVTDADRRDYERTLVRYPEGAQDAAQEVAQALGCGVLEQKKSGESADTVRNIEIILGRDAPPLPAATGPEAALPGRTP